MAKELSNTDGPVATPEDGRLPAGCVRVCWCARVYVVCVSLGMGRSETTWAVSSALCGQCRRSKILHDFPMLPSALKKRWEVAHH